MEPDDTEPSERYQRELKEAQGAFSIFKRLLRRGTRVPVPIKGLHTSVALLQGLNDDDELEMSGTAYLISSKVAVTAGHCVKDTKFPGESNEAASVRLWFGYSKEKPTPRVVSKRFSVHPDYNFKTKSGPDVALIFLDDNQSSVPIALGSTVDWDDEPSVSCTGYPGRGTHWGGSTQIFFDPTSGRRSGRQARYRMKTYSGMSGGLVWSPERPGIGQGVHLSWNSSEELARCFIADSALMRWVETSISENKIGLLT